ncbi:Protein FAM200B [Eumeta japonica]|uniref:Protein FAM200B n=1 Tax=Eumeta variegata TaxID=151549 RepID=A0A4C1WL08_EUMVA|nr:Protein FAM200B [Eumeta japonica]
MRRLITKHQKEANKPLDFFERKLKAASSINESALLASYKVAYRVAKAGKPHAIAENLILPAALDMGEIMIISLNLDLALYPYPGTALDSDPGHTIDSILGSYSVLVQFRSQFRFWFVPPNSATGPTLVCFPFCFLFQSHYRSPEVGTQPGYKY